jgi:hypothetical protein
VLDDLVGDLLDVTLDLNIGELATDETLGSEESVLGVNDGLTLGGNTNETLTILGDTDDGRSSTGTCRRIQSAIESIKNAFCRSSSRSDQKRKLVTLVDRQKEAKKSSHTLSVLNNLRGLALHDSNGGVGGTCIDSC